MACLPFLTLFAVVQSRWRSLMDPTTGELPESLCSGKHWVLLISRIIFMISSYLKNNSTGCPWIYHMSSLSLSTSPLISCAGFSSCKVSNYTVLSAFSRVRKGRTGVSWGGARPAWLLEALALLLHSWPQCKPTAAPVPFQLLSPLQGDAGTQLLGWKVASVHKWVSPAPRFCRISVFIHPTALKL